MNKRLPENHRGFTLIELMVAIAILAVVMAIAAPNFTNMLEGNRLKGATEETYQFLQYARAEAIAKSRTIYVDIRAEDTEWCVGYTDKDTCDCSLPSEGNANDCTLTIDGVVYTREIDSENHTDVTLTNITFAGDDYVIQMPRGTIDTSGTITFSTTNYTASARVGLLGRVRACSLQSDVGYASCD